MAANNVPSLGELRVSRSNSSNWICTYLATLEMRLFWLMFSVGAELNWAVKVLSFKTLSPKTGHERTGCNCGEYHGSKDPAHMLGVFW